MDAIMQSTLELFAVSATITALLFAGGVLFTEYMRWKSK